MLFCTSQTKDKGTFKFSIQNFTLGAHPWALPFVQCSLLFFFLESGINIIAPSEFREVISAAYFRVFLDLSKFDSRFTASAWR